MNLQSGSLPSATDLRTNRTEYRRAVLAQLGGNPCDIEELLEYNSRTFHLGNAAERLFPLADEPFVETWLLYAEAVLKAKSIAAICKWIPQLQFPIQKGISQTPEYRAAVARGQFTYPLYPASGLHLDSPECCQIFLNSTAAGRIPVILTANRNDFVSLVQAFTLKSEPSPVAHSMGAAIVSGYNNVHRIEMLRRTRVNSEQLPQTWEEQFKAIKEEKYLYQDRFIILSPGPYSAVSAAQLEIDEDQWLALSLAIRLEHECTHYFTRRVFGSMHNNILDELIADYCGLDKALGVYRETWALLFLGVEDDKRYRSGARLENYRGNLSLSTEAFELLAHLVRSAIANLAYLNSSTMEYRGTDLYRVASILTLASFNLEELADPSAGSELVSRFRACIASTLKTWRRDEPSQSGVQYDIKSGFWRG